MSLQHLIRKTKTKMKTTTLKVAAAFGLSALLVGTAAAQESKSKPVGYETITVPNGFSYAGLRLHEAPVGSGATTTVAGATVTLADGVADALVADTAYIFEVTSGDAAGAVVLVSAFDAAADTVTLSDDISADFNDGDEFVIRPSATLASVFGADNSAGLDAGSGSSVGADIVFVSNGAGGFDRYYYDSFNASSFGETWANTDGNAPVVAADVPLVYTDGLILLGDGADNNTFVVSGSVKLTEASLVLTAGFNYLSTIFPAGATIASTFGAENTSGLTEGSGSSVGADVIFIPQGAAFDRYYYDSFNANAFGPAWSNAEDNAVVDATNVSFDDASGIIILHEGADAAALFQEPAFYSTL